MKNKNDFNKTKEIVKNDFKKIENKNIFKENKEIIKKNLISRVDSIKNITSKDKYFEYLKDKNVSDGEAKIVQNKEKESEEEFKKNKKSFICLCLIISIMLYSLLFYISNSFEGSIFTSIFVFILSIFSSIFICIFIYCGSSESEIEYYKKNASPDELRDLYIKEFKANIEDYLSLNKQEIKEFCDSNEFIRAYVMNNPNEIFTRYSLNKVAGIKMNNLHMINEFKDIIDNNKILDGLPEGQKIIIKKSIIEEQKLNWKHIS